MGFVPCIVMPVTFAALAPTFDSVINCDAVAVPTVSLPKLSVPGARLMIIPNRLGSSLRTTRRVIADLETSIYYAVGHRRKRDRDGATCTCRKRTRAGVGLRKSGSRHNAGKA